VPLVPRAGVYKRPFQRGFQDRWDQAASPGETLFPLGAWFLEATDQWVVASWLVRGVPIDRSPPVEEVVTDASLAGWGARCGDQAVQGLWSEEQAS
jgi:hypothetical protein